MNLGFPGRQRADVAVIGRVRAWVESALDVSADSTVMVTQLQCLEPDCPPLETVIAVMSPGQPTRQFKIHKPVADLEQEDITSLAAGEHEEHEHTREVHS